MKRGTAAYEAAQEAMAEILLERARNGDRPIQYGELSKLLEEQGHNVPAHSVEMDLLLADVSRQESPDRKKAMLSAMVVFKDPNKREPGAGFYRLAREEFARKGDNMTIWGKEMERLARDYRQG
ncbi:hypothetical protein GTY41_14495 [Streptomyces sp. SID685]|uniref:hypothetical protein n=1 Tax=Streptomyces sp. SID685 TaxID=2690322 RepID=UPI00136FE51D|nr:hypothetical protein [Streptomyces sp. SID685]MYR86113.1 hypothetical protein [Streptomyces sp. SID685]